ncbi:MAG: YihA family ribosome biogenesis GTP-binding protein [Parachlamydiaceae bacterium]|nr:YihA family ribosome biogenesis GTP-binding protein [Parachlamydiaceae bacterium]
MTSYIFKHAKFIKTALKPVHYPVLRNVKEQIMPEVAVVGRSNVGKSTLLNHLFQSKGLVKTSASPGKTQAINFFTLNDQLAFVDLPGYGYAKVPLDTRKDWAPMIEQYLTTREPLQLILFLFDIRRIPNEEDLELLEWIAHHGKPVVLVLTKVDKVTVNVRNTNTQKILNALNYEMPFTHYSATENVGRQELIKKITHLLHPMDQHGRH